MAIRSFYVSWDHAVRDGDRLLENLARWTNLNAIELTNYDSDWGPTYKEVGSLVFPSDAPFKGLGLHLTTKERFATLQRFMESARSKGFDVVCNFTPLYANSKKFVPMACVDLTGAIVPGHNNLHAYGCPNNPDVVKYGQAMIRETMATWTSADLIAVNHVEFPFWANSSLHENFACFCDSCKARANVRGLDLTAVRRDVKTLYDSIAAGPTEGSVPRPLSPSDVLNYLVKHPNIGLWLDFRMQSMSEYISAVVKAGREAAKEHKRKVRIGLEFLPPTVSDVVGTDFASLYGMFDWISPKLVPEYLTASVIPRVVEYATKSEATDHPLLMSAIRQLFALGAAPPSYRKMSDQTEGLTYSNTFDPSSIDNQMRYLTPLVGKVDIHPYTWIHHQDPAALKKKLEKFRSYGLDGYFIWGWEHNLSEAALRKARKAF